MKGYIPLDNYLVFITVCLAVLVSGIIYYRLKLSRIGWADLKVYVWK